MVGIYMSLRMKFFCLYLWIVIKWQWLGNIFKGATDNHLIQNENFSNSHGIAIE
jgi:hypothetical protein